MNALVDIDAPAIVQAMAEDVFPADVAVSATFPWEAVRGLLPAEQKAMRGKLAKRQCEFAAGRRAAHAAMQILDLPVQAVPSDADRSPVWPANMTGSISHTDRICIATVAKRPAYMALGIDLEEDEDLPVDVIPVVCTPAELAWLSVQHPELQGRLARLIFSAKECAYKCQYTVSRTFLGFSDIEITPDLESGQFEATLARAVPGFDVRSCFFGRFAFGAGTILTGIALARNVSPT